METLTIEFGWNLVQQGLWRLGVEKLHSPLGLTPARAPTAAKEAATAKPGADPAAAKAATAKPGRAGKAVTPPQSMDSRAHSNGGSDASLSDEIEFARSRGSPHESAQSLEGLTGEAANQQRETLLEDERELQKRKLQTATADVQSCKEQVRKLTIKHSAVLNSCKEAEAGVEGAVAKLKKAAKKVQKAEAKRADALEREAEAIRLCREMQRQKREGEDALSFAEQELVAAEGQLASCTKIAHYRQTTLAKKCGKVLSSPTGEEPLGGVTQPLGGVIGGVKRPLEDLTRDKGELTGGLTSGVHDHSRTLSPPNPALSPHTYTWSDRP